MCGIFGKTNKTKVNYNLFKESLNLMKNRGIDEYGYYFDDVVSLGHRRLSILDKKTGKQPFIYNDLKMVYNGEIYNLDELRNDLIKSGYDFIGYSDTEVLIKGYDKYKLGILDKLEGIFAFCIVDKNSLILARDKFGVKPLYYAVYQNDLIFSSEIKSIISYTDYRDVDVYGLTRLLSISPMSEENKTVYKDIFELPQGSYLIYDGKINIKKYYDLTPKKISYSYDEAIKFIRNRLDYVIKTQLNSDRKVSTFLSGGLDSSIIYSVIRDIDKNILSTSLEYEDNFNYKSDEFNKSKDDLYIDYLKPKNHERVVIKNEELFNYLKDSLIARDYPGMADIDSSMYFLCKKIKEKSTVSLSGECADEVFGGYPWYFSDYDNFPWIRNLELKEKLLKIDLDLVGYTKNLYNEAIKNIKYLEEDDSLMRKKRKSMYLNIKYFMKNMLERKDRMSMAHSLEVRVPFCDSKIVDFMYNINPLYMNKSIEKSLLRDSYKDILPNEILNRKKSPYPKTYSKKYHEMIKNEVYKLFNSDSILNKIFNFEEIKKLENIEFKPFYGQLMGLDSFYGFLYQFNYWFNEYKIRLV